MPVRVALECSPPVEHGDFALIGQGRSCWLKSGEPIRMSREAVGVEVAAGADGEAGLAAAAPGP